MSAHIEMIFCNLVTSCKYATATRYYARKSNDRMVWPGQQNPPSSSPILALFHNGMIHEMVYFMYRNDGWNESILFILHLHSCHGVAT